MTSRGWAASPLSGSSPEQDERDSGLSITLTVSVGYQRRRPDTKGDRWEARLDSLGLLVVGAVIALVLVLLVLPRLLAWLGALGG